MDEKRYRVEYDRYCILNVMEDGEFNTASGYSIIADTKDNIIKMLTALGVDCTKLNEI